MTVKKGEFSANKNPYILLSMMAVKALHWWMAMTGSTGRQNNFIIQSP